MSGSAGRESLVPEYGDAWVYESIVGALPGVDVSDRFALAVQFVAFEAGILVLGALYGLWEAVVAGTIAVVVATAGSVEILRISDLVRQGDPPEEYRRLLFGSSVEVVLAVLAFIALVTYLFVFDPQRGGTTLVGTLLGAEPPMLPTYLMLLVLWDVCYRIGTGWWASVTSLWRSWNYRFDAARAQAYRRADLETMAFGLLQLVLVPFLTGHPVLLTVVVGHVVAVTTVSGLSVLLGYARMEATGAATN